MILQDQEEELNEQMEVYEVVSLVHNNQLLHQS